MPPTPGRATRSTRSWCRARSHAAASARSTNATRARRRRRRRGRSPKKRAAPHADRHSISESPIVYVGAGLPPLQTDEVGVLGPRRRGGDRDDARSGPHRAPARLRIDYDARAGRSRARRSVRARASERVETFFGRPLNVERGDVDAAFARAATTSSARTRRPARRTTRSNLRRPSRVVRRRVSPSTTRRSGSKARNDARALLRSRTGNACT